MGSDKVILPPDFRDIDGPLIFLAGPIRGAEDWQSEAIEIIHRADSGIYIASPRREVFDESFDFDVQTDWETKYLNLAAERGGILFWLAREAHHSCDNGRSYAQTTRFELATWVERFRHRDVGIVIGIEKGFSGVEYIRKMVSANIVIVDTLEDTCAEAVKIIKNKKMRR